MQKRVLQVLIFLSAVMVVFLAPAGSPTAAQSLLGPTPTIGAATPTPVPVGGNLAMVDSGAVLQATLGSLVWPAVGLVVLIGAVGFVVVRRRSDI